MTDPTITPISALSKDADLAAQRAVASGAEQTNPRPTGSDAADLWWRDYCRGLLLHGAPAAEAIEAA